MPSTRYAVRRLTPADLGLAHRLLALFGDVFEDPETYVGAVPGEDYLRRLLGRDHVLVLVATSGTTVVGGIVAYLLDKIERERSEVYIYDLAVSRDHRRRGVATALIREVGRLAARHGAHVVFVQADRGDDPAIALYSGLGRREDVLHFDIPVEDG